MFRTFEEAQNYVTENHVEFIDFKMLDMAGRWHHLTITPERFQPRIMTSGIGFDGSSYGFLTVEKSDMVFKPDLATGFLDPFRERKTLVFLTNIFVLDDHVQERFQSDPRFIASKTEALLTALSISDQALLGPEFEFYLLDDVSFRNDPHSFGVEIDAQAAHWNTDCHRGFNVKHHGGYHVDAPWDVTFDLRNNMVSLLEANGIPVKYHHPEVGGPGQMEIELSFGECLSMADRTMKLKYIVKNAAFNAGKTVTFMPKPFYGEAGNGMHVHMQFFNEGKPVFYDEDGYSHLSDLAQYAIGGILLHSPALMAFTNPSTNSYKRLVPGYEAPVSICYATANRSAVIRIPGYATESDEKRFEFRPSDAMCNPYLAYSALLMAAIDGIERKINPSDYNFGPFDVNIFNLPPEEREKIKHLPKSLEEAALALKNDYEFLLRDGVFTEGIIKDQIAKNIEEHRMINRIPTAKEFEQYYDL